MFPRNNRVRLYPSIFRKGQLTLQAARKSVEYQLACQEIITDDDDELERTFATLEKFICRITNTTKNQNTTQDDDYDDIDNNGSSDDDDDYEDVSVFSSTKNEFYGNQLQGEAGRGIGTY
ncbi:hypothetical protein TNCV_974941 [Trichonephila clavipes]|nr:hypothetical protein TNCV_974941 [Trichonephila clavipes]